MYVSFDPGETTGVAEFNDQGYITWYGQFKFDELVMYLHEYDKPVIAVICEDFKIRGGKAIKFVGNRLEVIQAIGVIRAFALVKKADYILQDASIKPMAEKMTQIHPKGPHSQTHWTDAANHGGYYLITNGIRKSQLRMEMEGEKNEG